MRALALHLFFAAVLNVPAFPAIAQGVPADRSVAVLIRGAGEHAAEGADHVWRSVAEALAKQPGLRVADEHAVETLPQAVTQPGQVAVALGMRLVLIGEMDGGPDIFRIALRLVDARSGASL
jgi:TolB-like protein